MAMGNRAVIKGKGSNLGVYVHWNGGYDSVLAFTQYCKLKGYRSPEVDNYGIARLCQVIGNFFGGNLSVGVWNMTGETKMTQELVESYLLDNGVYELEDWEIVAHWDDDLINHEPVNNNDESLIDFLCEIDKSMPEEEQLGEDFIRAEVIETSKLNIGDRVYIQLFNGSYEKHTVVGIAGPDEFHNGFIGGLPYVDLYEKDGDYSWNGNNYIRSKTVRRASKNIENGVYVLCD